jgi:ParB family chromosome partitioning protein
VEKERKKAPKKNVLGKGMAALLGGSDSIPNQPVKQELNKINRDAPIGPNSQLEVDIQKIKANPEQPRKIFKDQELRELSASIKQNGVIQPLIVAQNGENYELIAGERRLRASKLAGLKKVPVVVKKITKKESLVVSIIENVQRADLNCVEEALAYFQLMEEFSLTQEEVAAKIGKDRSVIANFLRILKMPREVIALLQKEKLSFGHAKVLAAIKDRNELILIATKAATENLSVRETEKLAKVKKKSSQKPSNKFFDERLESLKNKLEKSTGFHFDIATKNNGAGQVKIKFNNEAEFNDIFDYLLK